MKSIYKIGIVATSRHEAWELRDFFYNEHLNPNAKFKWHYIYKQEDALGLSLDAVIGLEGELMEYVKRYCIPNSKKLDVDIPEEEIEAYSEDELVPSQFWEFH